MSFFDASGMIPVYAPELTPVPTQPATPALPEAQGGGTQDSTSSSFGSLAQESQAAIDVLELNRSGGTARGGNPYMTPQAQAAAALIDLNGASSVTVSDYQLSVPPNLATATELVAQLTAKGNTGAAEIGAAEMGAAFQLLSPAAALALTRE